MPSLDRHIEATKKHALEIDQTRIYEITIDRSDNSYFYNRAITYINSFLKDCVPWFRFYIAYPDSLNVKYEYNIPKLNHSYCATILIHEPLFSLEEIRAKCQKYVPRHCINQISMLDTEIMINTERYDDKNHLIYERGMRPITKMNHRPIYHYCDSSEYYSSFEDCYTTEPLSDECGVEIDSDDQ